MTLTVKWKVFWHMHLSNQIWVTPPETHPLSFHLFVWQKLNICIFIILIIQDRHNTHCLIPIVIFNPLKTWIRLKHETLRPINLTHKLKTCYDNIIDLTSRDLSSPSRPIFRYFYIFTVFLYNISSPGIQVPPQDQYSNISTFPMFSYTTSHP